MARAAASTAVARAISPGFIVPPVLRRFARGHADAIERVLAPIRPDPGFAAPPAPVLFLCFTNRCGSNHLAQLLAATGVFNEAGEFCNADTVLEHAARLHLRTLHDYIAVLPTLVPPHQILAAKLGLDQLIMLADAGILDAWAPRARFLLLERQDRVAQAISRVIAAQTGRWSSAHAGLPGAVPHYDAAAIAVEMEAVAAANAGFYSFFAANRVVPFHTSYEAVCAAGAQVVAAIAAWLELEPPAIDRARLTLRRQRGPLNREWRARFAREPSPLPEPRS